MGGGGGCAAPYLPTSLKLDFSIQNSQSEQYGLAHQLNDGMNGETMDMHTLRNGAKMETIEPQKDCAMEWSINSEKINTRAANKSLRFVG